MQGVLACIDANGVSDCSGCLMGNGDVLLVLLSPRSSSERFGAGARPVHPIRVGSLRRTDSVAIEGIADIRRSLAARRSDANDPEPTWGGLKFRSAAVSHRAEPCYRFGPKLGRRCGQKPAMPVIGSE